MRFILGLVLAVLVAAAAYAGYWFFAASRIQAEAETWLAERRAEGWEAGAANLAVGGFPGAHRIAIDALNLAAPDGQGGWTLTSDGMSVQAGAPWNFSVWTVSPRGMTVLEPANAEPVSLQMNPGSLRIDATGGVINAFYFEARNLQIGSQTSPLRGAGAVFAQGQRADGAWRVQFESRSAEVAEGSFDDARTAFGNVIQLLALDLQAGEDGLAALAAAGAGLDEAGDLTVHAAHLEWGAAVLSGEGAVGVDPEGRMRGSFDVAVADAAGFLGALAGAGVVDPRQANVALAASALFPRDADDRMILPFSFREGETRLGPVTIGPAPQLVDSDS